MREKLVEWIYEFRELDDPGDGRTWTEHLADFLAERLSAYGNNLEVSRAILRETRIKLEKAEHDRDRYARKIEELTEENKRLTGENDYLVKEAIFAPMERGNTIVAVRDATARAMSSRIKERCIAGGIYPAFVARVVDEVAEELVEGVCDAPKDAVRATVEDLHTRFAMHFGTYTTEDTVKVSEVFRLLRKFEDEICDTTN